MRHVINAYDNDIVIHSIIIILYYISNKGLLEEYDKEENVEEMRPLLLPV
jgi:hypothetical protein